MSFNHQILTTFCPCGNFQLNPSLDSLQGQFWVSSALNILNPMFMFFALVWIHSRGNRFFISSSASSDYFNLPNYTFNSPHLREHRTRPDILTTSLPLPLSMEGIHPVLHPLQGHTSFLRAAARNHTQRSRCGLTRAPLNSSIKSTPLYPSIPHHMRQVKSIGLNSSSGLIQTYQWSLNTKQTFLLCSCAQ